MAVSTSFVSEFFTKRFGKQPDHDRDYYEQWVERFDSGHPQDYMDSESMGVYIKLLQERCKCE